MVARNRAANISKLFDFIKQVIERYRGINVICGSACDAMVLGSLIKGLSAAGVWPIQEPPYDGITFNELASVIADLKAVSLCDEIDSYVGIPISPSGGHALHILFSYKALSVADKVTGLDINTFQRRKRAS